jgi:hypothetical protein
MPRKPTQLEFEAFALHQELLWSVQSYWEDSDPLETPPSHYVLDEALYLKLLNFLKSQAGRAYPRRWTPSHPRNVRRGTNSRRLEHYEALCREFAEAGEKSPSDRALREMAKTEKQRTALEKALHRERKERQKFQEFLRTVLS